MKIGAEHRESFLVIQPAFIGDVILATAVVEKLCQFFPQSKIDFLVRAGNESLLKNNPVINNIIILDKKNNKLRNIFSAGFKARKEKYDYVINLHRFASSGIITLLSGAKNKIGFQKNPFSIFFTQKAKHTIGTDEHETQRNQVLISDITDHKPARPKLYPSVEDFSSVQKYKQDNYCCIAPTSVWKTKELPKEKWIELIKLLSAKHTVYLLGAPSDFNACEEILKAANSQRVINLTGKLSFLESAALMKDAQMNYVNDSAPLHIASAMNAPVTAFFCSTIPEFGFGPLSNDSKVIQTKEQLDCRPCGLHGYKSCPERHFKCGYGIEIINDL